MLTWVKSTMLAVQLMVIISTTDSSGTNNTILEPLSNVRALSGEELTFMCHVSGEFPLTWIWRNGTSQMKNGYSPGNLSLNRINKTESKIGIPGVTTTLLDLVLDGSNTFSISLLQFTVVDNLVPSEICCNTLCRMVTLKECPMADLLNLMVIKFRNHSNSAEISLELHALDDSTFNFTQTGMGTNQTSTQSLVMPTSEINITLSDSKEYIITVNNACCNDSCLIATVYIEVSRQQNNEEFILVNSTIISSTHDNNFTRSYYCMIERMMCEEINPQENINKSYYLKNKTTSRQSLSTTIHTMDDPIKDIMNSTHLQGLVLLIGIVGGSICAILVILVVTTSTVLLLVKKRKNKTKILDKEKAKAKVQVVPENDMEYDRVQFSQVNKEIEVEDAEYSTLNTGMQNIFQSNFLPFQQDEYSTINNQQSNNIWVKDDYEYTSIRCDDVPKSNSTKVIPHEKVYAELERDETVSSTIKTNASNVAIVDYSKIDVKQQSADSLLNMDTLLIQLREIAPKWEVLGIQLGFSATTLSHFKSITNGSDLDCLVELCDNWWRSITHPTWSMIAVALKDIGEQELSDELLKIYETGELPDKNQNLNNDHEYATEEEDAPPVPPQCF